MAAARSPLVDSALADLPDDLRWALEGLRALIADSAPEAVETIAYGVPAFTYRGRPLVSFSAGRAGRGPCALYVQSPAVLDSFRDELASYDASKGTVRFTPERPLPPEVVRRIVRARMAETDAAQPRRQR